MSLEDFIVKFVMALAQALNVQEKDGCIEFDVESKQHRMCSAEVLQFVVVNTDSHKKTINLESVDYLHETNPNMRYGYVEGLPSSIHIQDPTPIMYLVRREQGNFENVKDLSNFLKEMHKSDYRFPLPLPSRGKITVYGLDVFADAYETR